MHDTKAPIKILSTRVTKICAKMKGKHWKQTIWDCIFRFWIRENGFIRIPEINWKSAELQNTQKKEWMLLSHAANTETKKE